MRAGVVAGVTCNIAAVSCSKRCVLKLKKINAGQLPHSCAGSHRRRVQQARSDASVCVGRNLLAGCAVRFVAVFFVFASFEYVEESPSSLLPPDQPLSFYTLKAHRIEHQDTHAHHWAVSFSLLSLFPCLQTWASGIHEVPRL